MVFCFFGSAIEAKEKKYKNGDTYSGEWKKGKPEGMGKMVFANGSIYQGLWHDGKIAGEGSYKEASIEFDGTFTPIYENEELIKFKPIKGTLNTPDVKMTGEWDDHNVFQGTLTTKDFAFKGIYDSDGKVFKEGRIDGKDGSFIEGSMLLSPQFEGKMEKFVLQNSSVVDVPAIYTGKFVNGKFLGKIAGPQLSKSINEFEIEVKEDGTQYGSLTQKNGGKYKGYIKNKKYDGEGVLESKDGTLSGIWSNGILTDGKIIQRDSNGKTFNFNVTGRKITYTFEDGESVTIIDGIPDGYNKLYPKVIKYEEDRAEKKRQDAIKERQEQERLARAKSAKEIDAKYGGMIFLGEGTIMTLVDDGGMALIGALMGLSATQTLQVTFLPEGKVNVREFNSNVKSSDPTRLSDTQLLAAAMNSSKGINASAYLEGNKIMLNDDIYLVISNDKKYLDIYGKSASYRLKRKK